VPKKDAVPKEQLFAETTDSKTGPAKEQAWITDIAYPAEVYELHAKLSSANGMTGPVRVTGYIAVRVATGETTNSMTLYDLPGELKREGEQLLLGTLTFPTPGNYQVTVGPPSTPAPRP
jgi:hypothetical protein